MLVSEHDAAVRARIVEEAATFQTPPADAILRGAADDPDPRVRAAGCGAWERRGGPEAIQFLTARATTDADLGVRLRAIRGLGELRDQAATAVLVSLLDDPDPAVQTRVCTALGRATGLALGDDPKRWRQWAVQPGSAQSRWSFTNPFRGLW
jgi:HEAT repeat protein